MRYGSNFRVFPPLKDCLSWFHLLANPCLPYWFEILYQIRNLIESASIWECSVSVFSFPPAPRTIISPHYFTSANIVTCVFLQMELRIIFFQVVKISPNYIETLLGSVIDTWSKLGRECLSMFLKISFKSLYLFYSSLYEISLLFWGVRFIPRILWLFFSVVNRIISPL